MKLMNQQRVDQSWVLDKTIYDESAKIKNVRYKTAKYLKAMMYPLNES